MPLVVATKYFENIGLYPCEGEVPEQKMKITLLLMSSCRRSIATNHIVHEFYNRQQQDEVLYTLIIILPRQGSKFDFQPYGDVELF